MIPIYKPYLPKSCLKYAHEAIDSTWISSQGKYIEMTQEKLQELLNVKYVQLLNNGTSACHIVAKCLSRKYGKKQIIVQNNCYVAAWNAFIFDGNYELISVECDLETWNYDLNKLDKTIKQYPDAVVLIVHNIGNIINVPELKKKYPDTVFVEDACEGLFGKYNNEYAGTESFVSAFSTFANKSLTSGEGGFIATNDEGAYLYAKCIQGQGQSSKRFIHNELGYNYRISNLQSAILFGQFEVLHDILDMKQKIFDIYRSAFKDRDDVFIQKEDVNTKNANWMFGVRIPGSQSYDAAEKFFKAECIEVRPMFFEISAHQHLRNNTSVSISDCTNAKLLNKECVILPSYPELTKKEQKHIINTLEKYIKGL